MSSDWSLDRSLCTRFNSGIRVSLAYEFQSVFQKSRQNHRFHFISDYNAVRFFWLRLFRGTSLSLHLACT